MFVADAQPVVHLVQFSPVVVRGRGFQDSERVKVTVTPESGTARTRHIRAGDRGRFRIAFAHLVTKPCGRTAVAADGSGGSHARVEGTKHPDCIAD